MALIELELPLLSSLISLPDAAARDIQAGEPTCTIHPSVNADRKAAIGGKTALLPGMSADHDFARLVWLGLVEASPMQYVRRLLKERKVWIGTAVDEEMGLCFPAIYALLFEESPMLRGYGRQAFGNSGRSIGSQGYIAAIVQLIAGSFLREPGLQHHVFMVSP